MQAMSMLPPPCWIRLDNKNGANAADCSPVEVSQQYPDGLVCTTPAYIQIGTITEEPSRITGLLLKIKTCMARGRKLLPRSD